MARTVARRRPATTDHKPVLIALPIVSSDPYAGPAGRRHYTCSSCETSWAGGEQDCFNCGQPATGEHPNITAALQLLLRRPAARHA
ncbi:hypothetical protein ACIOJE_27160 [Kitasatospora sp. NPDC087861]|uniref:hypothetical protein n=1 Tax=Kitasatospora sp. NPDC087861 TaxID=3364070 RepID=UPI00380D063D